MNKIKIIFIVLNERMLNMNFFESIEFLAFKNTVESIGAVISFLGILIFIPKLYYIRKRKVKDISLRIDKLLISSKRTDYDELNILRLLDDIDEIVVLLCELGKLNIDFTINKLSVLNVILNRFFENHYDRRICEASLKLANIGLNLNENKFLSKFLSHNLNIITTYLNQLIMLENNKMDALNFMFLNTKESNEQYESEFDNIISTINVIKKTKKNLILQNIAFYRSNYSIYKKNLFLKIGDKQRLITSLENAVNSLNIYKLLNDSYNVARLQNNIGNLYILKGEFNLAEESIDDSLKIYNPIDFPFEYYRALVNLSTIYEELHLTTNEIEFLDKSIRNTKLALEFFNLSLYRTQNIILNLELSRRLFKLSIINNNFEKLSECMEVCKRLKFEVRLNKEKYLYISVIKANYLVLRYFREMNIMIEGVFEELLDYLYKLEDFYSSIHDLFELYNIYQEFTLLYKQYYDGSKSTYNNKIRHYINLHNKIKEELSKNITIETININEIKDNIIADKSYLGFEFFSILT